MENQKKQVSLEGKGEELETRQRILAAASQLMAQKGFKGATTRKISELAGVNEVTIFRHFTNKKGIVVELLSEMLDVRKPLENSLQGDFGQLREMLIDYGRTYYQLMVDRKELIMISLMECDNYPEVCKLFSNLPLSAIELLDIKLKGFQEQGHLPLSLNTWSISAMFISTFFHAFMAKYRLHIEFDLKVTEEELFVETTDIMLGGILNRT
ncbi:TetR/AcrR family transcriptional regulator [Brevibacillus invocatus]|uniref:TetR/AcrR family transcriptional regulator n=1 Tax=Brevibacillus invocatus TaxID=173959 RepID=UPI00203E7FF1|nr:TetR/AcrR family transcriptional regulator [Brevibacillus invocatus]MCM3077576.1 TetR/AcrR family transcriptional regulator [Brevibacillus invocatus]MCM3429587.1 TetR/AcrR family transcriptional regulator [Brevibacillus invocatus]